MALTEEPSVPLEAREALRHAQGLHGNGQIDDALNEARRAIAIAPAYVEALTYLGTTLITRRLAFADGLELLERAAELAAADASVHYSLGWCYEFVAYRLEKASGRPYRDPYELYELAAAELQRCLGSGPDKGMRDDAQDLLDSIERRL